MDARIKLPLTLAFILTCSLTPFGSWWVYILLLALVNSAAILSELGLYFLHKRALLALPFVLAAFPLIFTIPGNPLFTVGPGWFTLTASQQGLARFASITAKSWISLQVAILLAATTTFPDLLLGLRALHLPRLLVAVIGLMWRYLFVMVDEAARLLRARASRSGARDLPGKKVGGQLVWRARVTGGMAGNLFLRSFERSERIYAAMTARGYDGEVRSLPHPPLAQRDWLVLGIGLLVLLFLLLIG